MPVTKEQALTHDRFHYEPACSFHRTERWRRNGKTKVWKTRPAEFQVPVKYGLYGYGYITDVTAHQFHTEEDCPNGHS